MKKASSSKKPAGPRRRTVKPAAAPAPAENRLVRLVVQALDDKKAEDLRVLQVGKFSSITDYLIIATASSEPHQRALRVELEKVLDAEKARILGIDTAKESGWTVVDAFDVMVHIFTPENREKYRLDSLWKDADEIAVSGLLAKA
jgi:ribosome-associated protein